MTTAGWIFMIASLTFVWGIAIWCYGRMIFGPLPQDGGPKPPPTNL